jgi:hypothetical protein
VRLALFVILGDCRSVLNCREVSVGRRPERLRPEFDSCTLTSIAQKSVESKRQARNRERTVERLRAGAPAPVNGKGRSAKAGLPAGQQVQRSGFGLFVQWQHEKALASRSGLEVPDELSPRATEQAYGLT